MSRHRVEIRTSSKLNDRKHWAARYRQARQERRAAAWGIASARPVLPVTVTLTRISPGELDDDNLRGALKSIRDGVADALGVDDRDPRVTWAYGQMRGEKREYAVIVDIEPRDE